MPRGQNRVRPDRTRVHVSSPPVFRSRAGPVVRGVSPTQQALWSRTDVLRTADLDYHLPPERIATTPASPRDSARLLVVSRTDELRLEHRIVRDLPELLKPADLLVFNRTHVLPARIAGRKVPSGGHIPGLFVSETSPGRWIVMLKGSRLHAGTTIELHDASDRPTGVTLTLGDRAEEGWHVEVAGTAPGEAANAVLSRVGATPLPPYILKARRDAGVEPPDEQDRAWYQTVYADAQKAGSVAAPTAGLHFTPELLSALASRGVARADVTLHVGLGTFRPIETDHVEEHPIHEEWCEAPAPTIDDIRVARQRGGRVVAVGTTTARTLESVPPGADSGFVGPTRLLVTPGHEWRNLDAMLTNFHLPRSTLLAMVGALFPRGVSRLLEIYENAIREGYRFYSYGDAMLVLP